MNIFILGICGTFMANVALLARSLGHTVSGMDQNTYPPMSDVLTAESIDLIEGYDPKDFPDNIDLVVVGNVMRADYPIIKEVEKRGVSMTSGPAWLQECLGSDREIIAVSGTHGKTTTTTIITHLLQHAGKEPGYLVAGVPRESEKSSDLGKPPYFVIEADEYDTAFFDKRAKLLLYDASIWVVTNLEFDHADIYDSIEAIEAVFREKANALAESAVAVIADDDPRVRDVMTNTKASVTTFGLQSGDWYAKEKSADGRSFVLCHKGDESIQVNWPEPGDHNVKNALAASAVAELCGCSLTQISEGLACFQGVKRRFEKLGTHNEITLYDDFAHHPTAIQYAVSALRASIADDRLVAIVYFASNTMRGGLHPAELFKEALEKADEVFLLAGSDDLSFLESVSATLDMPSSVIASQELLTDALKATLKAGDQVLFMGNRSMQATQKALLT